MIHKNSKIQPSQPSNSVSENSNHHEHKYVITPSFDHQTKYRKWVCKYCGQPFDLMEF